MPPLNPPSLPPLTYAPAPTARRRWGRRVLRWWPAGLLLTLAIGGDVYGPGVWKRYQLLKLQAACLTADLPHDRPVLEIDPAAARALVAARPGEYALDPDQRAVRADPRWAALAAAIGAGPGPAVPAAPPPPTTFCHERVTPDGRRRLVVLQTWDGVTVIEPAGWTGGGPRVVRWEVADYDRASRTALLLAYRIGGRTRLWAGVPDPADPSRFTVPFDYDGVAGTWEYRLDDDDWVTMRLLDPAAFTARAITAWAKRRVGAARW